MTLSLWIGVFKFLINVLAPRINNEHFFEFKSKNLAPTLRFDRNLKKDIALREDSKNLLLFHETR